MAQGTILIIEDEEEDREHIMSVFENKNYCFLEAERISEAKNILKNQAIDLVLLDNQLKGVQKGVEYIGEIKKNFPATQVIMLTKSYDTKLIVNAMKLGAFYFLTKPIDSQELALLTEKALEVSRTERQNQALEQKNYVLQQRLKIKNENKMVLGTSEIIRNIVNHLQVVNDSGSDVSILLMGESGTGKEVFAKYVNQHAQSMMEGDRPFIAVNCTSIQKSLFESEFFGYEKGAFTGAEKTKLGFFEWAEGGDIFLDEIGDMPLEFQTKLLRVLQEKKIRRVGGIKDISSNFRLISATNKNLKEAVKLGTFREDLYYRINTIDFEIPPLRQRIEDIPLLVTFFIKQMALKTGRVYIPFKQNFIKKLQRYSWPGNVRQLKGVVDKLLILGFDGKDYNESFLPQAGEISEYELSYKPNKLINGENEFLINHFLNKLRQKKNVDIHEFLKSFEKFLLEEALEAVDQNGVEAAQLLSLKKPTFYKKLKFHGI